MSLEQAPHRRYNPLTDEWILVSPHRTARPWQGQQETPTPQERPRHDPSCYLCPGVERANGARNPDYSGVYAFDNDFAALKPDVAERSQSDGLFVAESERGICRVLCFDPRHDLTLAEMEPAGIERVIEAWIAQTAELGGIDWVKHVQVFENRGAAMGASNPHPHGQIWANATIPTLVERELAAQERYYRAHGRALLSDYAAAEAARGERTIVSNEEWIIVVPYWATWPFETLILPLRRIGSLGELTSSERGQLALALKDLLVRYDNLFSTSFPYSFGWHQAPTDGVERPYHCLHGHIYPPLLRSATVRKFMVGYEMLGQAQRDLTPEQAAERLRSQSTRHWSLGTG